MFDVLQDQLRLEEEVSGMCIPAGVGCRTHACGGVGWQAARELRMARCSRVGSGSQPTAQEVFSCLTCYEATGVPLGLCRGCVLAFRTSRN